MFRILPSAQVNQGQPGVSHQDRPLPYARDYLRGIAAGQAYKGSWRRRHRLGIIMSNAACKGVIQPAEPSKCVNNLSKNQVF